MIIDAASIHRNGVVDADVCIVGAGAAGISLARELSGTCFTVCVLESGCEKPTRRIRSLSAGENVGEPYRPLQYARARALGGTTNVWYGGCEELDAIDFEKRHWVPYSGWPFSKDHLAPFYSRAYTTCGLPSFAFDPNWERTFLADLPFRHDAISPSILYIGEKTNFWVLHGENLTSADNVTVYTNATAVEVIPNAHTQRVERIRAMSHKGEEFYVRAKLFVLAAGGLENPRLLLTSRRTTKNGLGNEHDLVGRFLMTHPGLDSGILFPAGDRFDRAWIRFANSNARFPKTSLRLSSDVQCRSRLLNITTTLHATHVGAESPGVGSLYYLQQEKTMTHWSYLPSDYADHFGNIVSDFPAVSMYLVKRFARRRWPRTGIEAFRLFTWMESAPNPDSRVTLSDRKDRFGMGRVKLDWRISDSDIPSVRRSHMLFSEYFASAGAGRLLSLLADPAQARPPTLRASAHHIGATRMHQDPKQGVVDANCAIHGVPNLYVVGSSVFPTSGAARPTLTIVALALRLADRVKHQLKRDMVVL